MVAAAGLATSSLRQSTVFTNEHTHDYASHGPGTCRRGPGELFPMRLHCWRRSKQHLDGIALASLDGIIREPRLRRPSCGHRGHNVDLRRLRSVIAGEKTEHELAACIRGNF